MTFAIWQGIVHGLAAAGRAILHVFAPGGNLLVSDILAEVTVLVTSKGERKILANKLTGPQQADQAVQGLIWAAIETGKPFGISINWAMLEQVAPYQGPKPPVA